MPNYEFYKDFCVKYEEYMMQPSNDDNPYSLNRKTIIGPRLLHEICQSAINEVQNAFDKKYYRKLTDIFKSTAHDIFEMGDYEFIDQYNPYFIEKYGIDLYSLNVKLQKKIEKIIARGKIRTDEEFRLINERVDELCQNDGDAELIEACNKMLLDYEERAAEKLNKRKKKSES